MPPCSTLDQQTSKNGRSPISIAVTILLLTSYFQPIIQRKRRKRYFSYPYAFDIRWSTSLFFLFTHGVADFSLPNEDQAGCSPLKGGGGVKRQFLNVRYAKFYQYLLFLQRIHGFPEFH